MFNADGGLHRDGHDGLSVSYSRDFVDRLGAIGSRPICGTFFMSSKKVTEQEYKRAFNVQGRAIVDFEEVLFPSWKKGLLTKRSIKWQ